MTPRVRIRHVITRLLLSVAVLLCVLGLAEGGASAAANQGVSAIAAPMATHGDAGVQILHGGMAGMGVSAHGASAPPGGHSGHGDSNGMHMVNCMVPRERLR